MDSAIKTLDITRDKFEIKFYLEEFINFLNQLAHEFEMNNTSFTNPHGLDDELNYSTVRDLSILTHKAYEDP